jgi:hypothetical protein
VGLPIAQIGVDLLEKRVALLRRERPGCLEDPETGIVLELVEGY